MSKSVELCDDCVIHEDAVARARERMPADREMEALAVLFKVMGDQTRMRIACALAEGELCVCDIAALLGMTKSAISHQLGTLRDAKLVRFRRDGRNVYYSLDDEHVADILRIAREHARHG